ncbi:hypothetical protein [Nocardioides salarius]|uniref:hypothetical protein n=1 Tax=Nocardioides salarius TaxID=374513 RepID=UPI0030FCB7EF
MSSRVQHDRRFPREDGEEPGGLEQEQDGQRRVLVVAAWVLVGFVVLVQLPWVVAAFAEDPHMGAWWVLTVVPWMTAVLVVPVATLIGLAWVGAGFGRPDLAPAPGRSACTSTLTSVAVLLLVLEILVVGTIVSLGWAL